MQVDVLIFGAAGVAAGSDRVTVRVGDAPTVGEVCAALTQQFPALMFALASPRLAINHAFATPQDPVRHDDEVALITLVSGG